MKLGVDIPVEELVFDYSQEQEDDIVLQNILVLCESLQGLDKEIKGSKKALEFSRDFINTKIDYLEGIQESFGLPNKSSRFRNISRYLDSLTIEYYQVNPMNDFADKVSGLLDTLYLVNNQITLTIDNYEKINEKYSKIEE